MRGIIKSLPMVIAVATLVSVVAAGCAATANGTSPKPAPDRQAGFAGTTPSGVSSQSAGRPAKTARNESLRTRSLPRLSAAFIKAVNLTDVRIVAASKTASVTEESAVAAVLAELPPGSSAKAGDLVMLTNAQHPDGVLAWAIESTGSFGWVSGGPVDIRGTAGAHHYQPPRPPPNFRVDFVNATTGTWLEGVEGYSSSL